VGIFVEGREVEKQRFEDCFLDDRLEFFDSCIGLLKALFDRKLLETLGLVRKES